MPIFILPNYTQQFLSIIFLISANVCYNAELFSIFFGFIFCLSDISIRGTAYSMPALRKAIFRHRTSSFLTFKYQHLSLWFVSLDNHAQFPLPFGAWNSVGLSITYPLLNGVIDSAKIYLNLKQHIYVKSWLPFI